MSRTSASDSDATVRVIGAGLGRTGTTSLWTALRQILAAPCYNMKEFMGHPEHAPQWTKAAQGVDVNWRALFKGYGAVVDWPAASFWYEISQAYPDALIVLTLREPEAWWESADQTIFRRMRSAPPNPVLNAVNDVFAARFCSDINNRDACLNAFRMHYDDVRARAPADRLLEWSPGEGWQSLCDRLGLAVPSFEFPHVNTREEFLKSQ